MSTTWASVNSNDRHRRATCTTGSEDDPSSDSSDGLDLTTNGGSRKVNCFIKSTNGSTEIHSGTVAFYYWNPASSEWHYVLGLEAALSSGHVRQSLPAIEVEKDTRLSARPKNVVNSSGATIAVTIDLISVHPNQMFDP